MDSQFDIGSVVTVTDLRGRTHRMMVTDVRSPGMPGSPVRAKLLANGADFAANQMCDGRWLQFSASPGVPGTWSW